MYDREKRYLNPRGLAPWRSQHGGFERDLQTGELLEKETGENQGYAMCRELDGIDILVTGHQHREIAEKLFGKTVIQPGIKGSCLGEIVITVTKDKDRIISISHEPSLIYVDEQVQTDEEVCRLLRPLYNETEEWLNQPIGVVDGDMYIYRSISSKVAGASIF